MDYRVDWQKELLIKAIDQIEEKQMLTTLEDAHAFSMTGQGDEDAYVNFHENCEEILMEMHTRMDQLFEINALIHEYNEKWGTSMDLVDLEEI